MTLSLRSPLLTRHGFRHGFSLRDGGVSPPPFDALNLARGVGDDLRNVAENHARFASDVGYDLARLYEVSQVHGAAVCNVDGSLTPAQARAREADALCCAGAARELAGTAIAVRVADCAAVLFAHPKSGAVAAAHAGWRGVVDGVLAATLAALAKPASELIAAVFPHIGVDAFEVGPEVAAQIAASVAEDPSVIASGRAKPHADLAKAIEVQLARAGLSRHNVERVPGCTFQEPARFFSYRRDGARSGRHLAVIVAGC